MLRLFGGFLINNIEFSIWLTGFLFFVFLSLGAMKRFIEIIKLKDNPSGRGYVAIDSQIVQNLGLSSVLLHL